MKTNKKLKLNTKKVVILSEGQQESVQGGNTLVPPKPIKTDMLCSAQACSQLPPPWSCI